MKQSSFLPDRKVTCSRCRRLINPANEAVVDVRIGNFPVRRLCEGCGQHLQLEAVSPPHLENTLPIDPSPRPVGANP